MTVFQFDELWYMGAQVSSCGTWMV